MTQNYKIIKKISDIVHRARILLKNNKIPTYSLDAELIVSKVLFDGSRENMFLHINDECIISDVFMADINCMIERRLGHEPMAYILRSKAFWKYDFYINQHVLIPRPESEFIVEEALRHLSSVRSSKHILRILDMGVGSGCLILSIIKELCDDNNYDKHIVNGTAIDVSREAIDVAKYNAKKLNIIESVTFLLRNYIDFFHNGCDRKYFGDSCYDLEYDVIVANPPYISQSDYYKLDRSVIHFEPKVALIGGESGLEHYTAVMCCAKFYMSDVGRLVVECGDGQMDDVIRVAIAYNLILDRIIYDFAGIARIAVFSKSVSII